MPQLFHLPSTLQQPVLQFAVSAVPHPSPPCFGAGFVHVRVFVPPPQLFVQSPHLDHLPVCTRQNTAHLEGPYPLQQLNQQYNAQGGQFFNGPCTGSGAHAADVQLPFSE